MGNPEANTVLVDVDEVLGEFVLHVLDRMREQIPNFEPRPQRHFHLNRVYPEHAQLIHDTIREPGFIASIPLKPDAIEGLEGIRELGYNFRLCTSPALDHPTCQEEKLQWIRKLLVPVFGSSVETEAIITRNKHLYDGFALIDDNVKMSDLRGVAWTHILRKQPYHEHMRIDTPYVIDSLTDPTLPEVLDACREQTQRRLGTFALVRQ